MSINPIVEKIAPQQFKLTYAHLPDFELKMDFSPIIKQFNLVGRFCLLHWQAKPKGLRRWGVYDGKTDSYFASDWDKIEVKFGSQIIPLQVDEERVFSVPTAVLFLPNCNCHQGKFLSIL